MRLQLALNVHKLDQAIDFYSKLFETKPHKIRPGYANSAIESPPLKLVLFENANAAERLNHLGIEMFNSSDIENAHNRLQKHTVLDTIEENSNCCHAIQYKIWSQEPQGLAWEWYLITDDNPDDTHKNNCCDSQAADTAHCCN